MKHCIEYKFEFTDFANMNFNNCFSSAYKFLTKDDERWSRFNQCDLFFMFGTLSGQNVTRLPFDENEVEAEWLIDNTEVQIDFLMGLAGYAYRKVTDEFHDEIITSIQRCKPVIAKMKEDDGGSFRLIIGYDEGRLLCPNYQENSEKQSIISDIEAIYIFENEIMPRYTFIDGLKQIKKILEHNRERDLWSVFRNKFYGYWDDKLHEASFDMLKSRFARVEKVMWHTFNCHNFGEAWGKRAFNGMEDERFNHAYSLISDACYTIHMCAWQVIAINKMIDWSKNEHFDYTLEWALSCAVGQSINAINKYDRMILDAVNEMIEITEQ